ncbi:MAG TPA: helix-turn-helix transcriptional regulator [Lachnospiraceae bacterium]|nr:helix-turn-helix transcriptional regulator [Lachnospiraceae bacterium]
MKEINIASMIVIKRREKGITQEELAAYVGVSKASVSKWETGLSYPDITLLPQLATYFNISIDELMGYSPQMTKEDIRKLYSRLASDFATKPFLEVLEECREVIKKYYSCFPLLLQIAILLMNHHMLTEDRQLQMEILKEATELCIRVKKECDDVWVSKDAVSIEAACHLMSQQPVEVLELLGETIRPISSDIEMIAQAYHLMGNTVKAKDVTQINMYQHLAALVGSTPLYLLLNADNLDMVDEIFARATALADIYNLEKLQPNSMAVTYLSAAQVYCMNGKMDKGLQILKKYTDLCIEDFFPYALHGDSFFHSIESWFEELDLGQTVPRDEKTIKESMLQGVVANPVFDCLKDNPQYKILVHRLKDNI